MSGWKWVPVEPTPVMLAQGQWKQVPSYAPVTDCVNANIKAGEIYKAMLANAPAAPYDIIDVVREILPVLNKNWPSEVDRTPLNKLIEAFIKATS